MTASAEAAALMDASRTYNREVSDLLASLRFAVNRLGQAIDSNASPEAQGRLNQEVEAFFAAIGRVEAESKEPALAIENHAVALEEAVSR